MLQSCGSQDTCPIGFPSEMFWELISQVEVLKVEVSKLVLESFAPWGEVSGFEFSSSYGSFLGVVLWQDCAPVSLIHLDVICPIGSHHSATIFFFLRRKLFSL